MRYENDEQFKNELSHGAGIDADWNIEFKESKAIDQFNSVHCSNSYHVMNEVGMYVGWIDFTCVYTINYIGIPTLSDLEIDKSDITHLENSFSDLYLDDIDDMLWQRLTIY